jgi:diamine N-acetyltransferase
MTAGMDDRRDRIRVSLRPVTRDNWMDCARLTVADGQEAFVASNVFSLAEAAYTPGRTPFAVCRGGAVVGFVMISDRGSGRYWIDRLMIGEQHQGRGYGRAALAALLDLLGSRAGCREVCVSHHPDNRAAARLYRSFGFIAAGRAPRGEMMLRRPLEILSDRPVP